MRERDIEGPSKRYARAQGWWVRKFKSPAHRSAPDDMFAKRKPNGRSQVFFVEFKATGEEPTELQLDEHEQMRTAGLTIYVCDNREWFREILEIEESKRLTE